MAKKAEMIPKQGKSENTGGKRIKQVHWSKGGRRKRKEKGGEKNIVSFCCCCFSTCLNFFFLFVVLLCFVLFLRISHLIVHVPSISVHQGQ